MTAASFYEIAVKDKRGNAYDLAQLKGKTVIIVNVASKCGFTPQYKGLETLYQSYKDQGLVILGFPCNQFGSQAPGSAEEEGQVCQLNHGVTFPILEKCDVNGDEAHPLWEYLKGEKKSLGMKRVKWNFEKFVVDRNGQVVERYASTTEPSAMEKDIKKYL
ncbi:glutathione peroxidase gpx1 [Thoreauomyces humboldtii]|nr:glutathione peroxidase gpx1 [Thoreauomyces humboldtii]